MANDEYIKSLEERIEKLEMFIKLINLDDRQNIIFSGCNIGPVALEKCKKITFEYNQMETGVFTGLANHVTSSTIHNFESVHSKTAIKKCNIQNFCEE